MRGEGRLVCCVLLASSGARGHRSLQASCPHAIYETCSAYESHPGYIGPPAPAWSSCARPFATGSCNLMPDPDCCSNATICLATALSLCSSMPSCYGIALNPDWGVRVYGAALTIPSNWVANPNWQLHIKHCWGCSQPQALNFDPLATEDDGSCEHLYGCLDATNPAYNANATSHNQSLCDPPPPPPPISMAPPTPPAVTTGMTPPCSGGGGQALQARLLSLLGRPDCSAALQPVANATAELPCSAACSDAVLKDGVFHVCDPSGAAEACLAAVDGVPSWCVLWSVNTTLTARYD